MTLEAAAVRFGGLDVLTSPGRVMVPRATSQALVDRAVTHVEGLEAPVAADAGTGSGALAVALATRVPAAIVWATDRSPAAVALARRNAMRHGVGDRVLVREGDLLLPAPGPFDVVVANLPYLAERDRALFPELDGEPPEAVFAPGDGLGPLRRLLRQADRRLAQSGLLIVQFRGEVHEAGRGGLAALGRRLERSQANAWRAAV